MPAQLPIAAVVAVFGLFVGSFLAALVVRLPQSQPIVFARSRCPECGSGLSPIELLPLLSWAVQRGRCRSCSAAISGFYPAMEMAAALVGVWASFVATGFVLVATCALGWCLLALVAIDIRIFRLANALTLSLAVMGLAAAMVLDRARIADHAAGACVGFFFLIAVGAAYRAVRGREGIGLGDAKLLGGAGAWVGWQGLPSIMLIASVAGLLAVLLGVATGRRFTFETRLPYGAFLCFGLWIVWLYGPLEP